MICSILRFFSVYWIESPIAACLAQGAQTVGGLRGLLGMGYIRCIPIVAGLNLFTVLGIP